MSKTESLRAIANSLVLEFHSYNITKLMGLYRSLSQRNWWYEQVICPWHRTYCTDARDCAVQIVSRAIERHNSTKDGIDQELSILTLYKRAKRLGLTNPLVEMFKKENSPRNNRRGKIPFDFTLQIVKQHFSVEMTSDTNTKNDNAIKLFLQKENPAECLIFITKQYDYNGLIQGIKTKGRKQQSNILFDEPTAMEGLFEPGDQILNDSIDKTQKLREQFEPRIVKLGTTILQERGFL